ncbi:MAG: hypothetical protein ACQEP7_03090 [bacterium]
MADYDKERLKSDPDYRQQVLDNIAGKTRQRWFYARLKTMAMVLVGLSLFTAGFFVGGLLEYSKVWMGTLIIVCLFIVPMMAWILVDVHRYRRQQSDSVNSGDLPGNITGDEVNG